MENRDKESYHEPLLVKHEPLRDLTGFTKYVEKIRTEDSELGA